MRVRNIAKSDYYLRHVSLSVCPPAWNNSAPTVQIYMKFGILGFFEKSVEKIQVSLKLEKNNGHFKRRFTYTYEIT
jgi:hypothetical protein